nr:MULTISPECIES: FAD-dependent oxidoreductase [Spiroplasma]
MNHYYLVRWNQSGYQYQIENPYAVVQLCQDNAIDSLYNIVGFQTNLKFPEQKRIIRN